MIVGREGYDGLELGDNHQIVQLAQSGENGQFVLQVIEQNQTTESGTEEQEAHEGGETSKATPRRGGSRKRKNTATLDPSITPSRPKRNVVPNIKSEFVYDTITSSTTNVAIAAATAASVTETSNAEEQTGADDQEQTTYTFVQDGDTITAWQTIGGENAQGAKDNF